MNEPVLPKGYTCPHCATFNEFNGWVYAHWNETLFHRCDCGQTNNVLRGNVLPSGRPGPELAPKKRRGRNPQ